MLDFLLAPANGIPTQPGNFNQALEISLVSLAGQQTNEATPVTFIQRCQNTIDGAMFLGTRAVGMVPTRLTGACMNG